MAQDIIFKTRGLTKGFKGLTTAPDVNLCMQRRSIYALIGPNGAGKMTCFNLLTKSLVPTRGAILFNGVDIASEKSAQITRRGVTRSFQIFAVFPHLTVTEDIRVGLQRQLDMAYAFWHSEQLLNTLNARAMELLGQVGLTEFVHTVTVELPYGRKRALEITTALVMESGLMLLDESMQGTGYEDVDRVTELIKRVARGRTILMVEHNMSVVSSIIDKITVLQHGQILAKGPYEDVSKNPQVMGAYMGIADAALEGH